MKAGIVRLGFLCRGKCSMLSDHQVRKSIVVENCLCGKLEKSTQERNVGCINGPVWGQTLRSPFAPCENKASCRGSLAKEMSHHTVNCWNNLLLCDQDTLAQNTTREENKHTPWEPAVESATSEHPEENNTTIHPSSSTSHRPAR